MELLGGDRLGKYEIVGRLAAGGMAEVYLARSIGHGGFAKIVALKRMLPDLAQEPGFREMFMQEAAVAARLNHAQIVQIFDFAEEGGELYLAMELVHGVTLRRLNRDICARLQAQPEGGLRLGPVLAAEICRRVARALAYAWQVPDDQGVPLHLIHRDVTPHNILLSYEGDVKLADFGIAKPADRRTSVGLLKGKLLYMAPEQLTGAPLDARTDLFALGIVLYETALGLRKPLFDAAAEDAVKSAVQTRKVVPPDRMDPDIPKELSAIIMKSLEREPERRFQSAAELADALGEAIHRAAKGPQDCDLSLFLRKLYGEPPPICSTRPLGETHASDLSRGSVSGGRSRYELDRRTDGPLSPAVAGVEADALRDRPAPSEITIDERMKSVRPSPGAPPDGGQRVGVVLRGHTEILPAEGRRSARRRVGRVAVAAAIALVAAAALLVPMSQRTQPPPESTAAPAPGAPLALDESEVQERAAAPAVLAGASAPLHTLPTVPPEVPQTAPLETASAVQVPSGRPAINLNPPNPAANRSVGRLAPAQQKQAKGVLTIYVRPWVFAWVDGEKYTGSSAQEAAPMLRRQLSAGRHEIHLREAGGREQVVRVDVPAGGSRSIEGSFDHLVVR